MNTYPFKDIEAKWQKYWDEHKLYRVVEDESFPPDKRKYILDMFPYPSGSGLHVGHPEGYVATDIYSRYLRMNGCNVLHPMGFDSFGLPAETYAIETGTHPRATTESNIVNFRRQLKRLGFSYDWDREISTHNPDYYKWTQWIFLKLWERGLAYIAEIPVWYCEELGTVLANEEVLNTESGPRSERGGHPVVRRPLRQWMLKITHYAERLLEDLDELDWPESLKIMQRNWIGRSEGANVIFKLDVSAEKDRVSAQIGQGRNEPSGQSAEGAGEQFIEVFTTRPDTLFGATYMVLAPEHSLVHSITSSEQKAQVNEYIRMAALKSDLERTDLAKEKTGVFTGAYAINPVNNERIPVWISDYILINYGTGAIMSVPAHDERDFAFAQQFGLPIRQVVMSAKEYREQHGGENAEQPAQMKEAFTAEGIAINSGQISGLPTSEAKSNIIDWLEEQGCGTRTVNYKLRDWIFSRQRYWGEPIPLVADAQGNYTAIPESELPLTLPEVESYKPAGTGEGPLATLTDWVNTEVPGAAGTPAKRETNTMPQWAGSCWYYLRYIDPKNPNALADEEKIRYWMPVDLYVGGTEHAVLHLLYARFWHKVLYDCGVVNTKEPFARLVNQGMITAYAYQRPDGSLVPVDEVEEIEQGIYSEIGKGTELRQIISKMSKSLKNGANPDEVIDSYGADSMRLYEMFMGPLEQSKPWSTQGLIGIHRFLEKVWRTSQIPMIDPASGPASKQSPDPAMLKTLHKTIKKVGADTATLSFNTAISQMMIFINEALKQEKLNISLWKNFLLLLAPYAPHIAEELWHKAGESESIVLQPWPKYNEALTQDETITLVLQINGKIRSKLQIARNTSTQELETIALADKRIAELTAGKTIRKVIAVPNKLVNIVCSD